jgi:hypothetical protein
MKRIEIFFIIEKRKMNFVEIIIIFLVLLKYVQNQSCPDWKEWKDFKKNFSIGFYNSSLETVA